MKLDLARRPRRNRRTESIRALSRETQLVVDDLIQPLFVKDIDADREPILSMPGVSRLNPDALAAECVELEELGIRAVALFPVLDASQKDASGSAATDEDSILFRAIRIIKSACPKLLVICDVALDPFTDHGHDGLLSASGDEVANDATVAKLCELAVLEAAAGADIVAPSDMMDGRVGAIRQALDAEGFDQTAILSYAAKFASAYYGPFRDAVQASRSSGLGYLDKRSYQLDPANAREALLEAALDEEEGADILMVKPAGPYLDIIRSVRETTPLPVAAYQVSGEYSQIHAAAQNGWLDFEKARDESLIAIKRAGADMILTYFAKEAAAAMRP